MRRSPAKLTSERRTGRDGMSFWKFISAGVTSVADVIWFLMSATLRCWTGGRFWVFSFLDGDPEDDTEASDGEADELDDAEETMGY